MDITEALRKVGEGIAQLQSSVSRLDAADATRLQALVAESHRLERQLSGARLAAVAELQRRAAERSQGDTRQVRDLLQRTAHATPSEAKRTVATASGLGSMPRTRAALQEGRIDADRAEMIVRTAAGLDPEHRKRIDRVGADVATVGTRPQLRRALDETVHRFAPDDLRQRERLAIIRRSCTMWVTEQEVEGRFRLPKPQGEALLTAINARSRPHSKDDDRTIEQRQADALAQLARDDLDRGGSPRAGGFVPHVAVTASHATLHGRAGAPPAQLAHSGAISDETARELACDCAISRIVMRTRSQPLDVGRASRTATAAQRRALIARDGGCVGCGAPPGWCQAHHIRWWRRKGRTDLRNLVLVCWACHDKVHHLGWTVVEDPKGGFRLKPPDDSAPPQTAGEGSGRTRAAATPDYAAADAPGPSPVAPMGGPMTSPAATSLANAPAPLAVLAKASSVGPEVPGGAPDRGG